MALFNHRKMLAPYLPVKGFNLTVFIPCFQLYPPSPPPPPPPPPTNLSLVVTTMICILGSVLLFLFLVVFLYLHITQSRHSSAAEVTPGYTNRREEEDEAEERDFSGDHHHHVWRINTSGLHRSVIESITVVGFKKGQGIVDGAECSVCLNEFEEDESLRLLPKCSHAFHINCIDTWLLSHKNCPLCRAPVVLLTETLHQETESGSSNELQGEEEESLGSRNVNVLLSRAQSDLANHCGSANVKTMRRTFSVGGS